MPSQSCAHLERCEAATSMTLTCIPQRCNNVRYAEQSWIHVCAVGVTQATQLSWDGRNSQRSRIGTGSLLLCKVSLVQLCSTHTLDPRSPRHALCAERSRASSKCSDCGASTLVNCTEQAPSATAVRSARPAHRDASTRPAPCATLPAAPAHRQRAAKHALVATSSRRRAPPPPSPRRGALMRAGAPAQSTTRDRTWWTSCGPPPSSRGSAPPPARPAEPRTAGARPGAPHGSRRRPRARALRGPSRARGG